MISKTSTVSPFFFACLTKVNHYLSAWQVLKKSVRGNGLKSSTVLLLRLVSCNLSYAYYVEIYQPRFQTKIHLNSFHAEKASKDD